jgi:hypothetical protein
MEPLLPSCRNRSLEELFPYFEGNDHEARDKASGKVRNGKAIYDTGIGESLNIEADETQFHRGGNGRAVWCAVPSRMGKA